MHYLAIDFELANTWNRASACSVGIIEVKNNEIVDEFYTLINPLDEFEDFCIDIHGITPDMIEDQPTFKEIWPELIEILENNLIVAHNASFDMSVLRHCLNRYNLQFPEINYACSYLLSKRIYPGLSSYRLNHLIAHHGLSSFDHHHALDDAKAASDLFNKCISDSGFEDFDELLNHHNYKIGQLLTDNSYKPFRSTYRNKDYMADARNVTTSNTEFDENHPFFDKTFTFTGTLKSMTRKNAMQKIVDIGGKCGNGVTMKTNYLVVGIQDLTRFKEGVSKSSKMLKAEEYANRGLDIEIIAEDDFLNLI